MSDSDSVDSDDGIRYKTENVRNKHEERSYKHSICTENKDRKRSSSRTSSPSRSCNRDIEKHSRKTSEASNNLSKGENDIIGPALPPGFLNKIGPALPPHPVKLTSEPLPVEPALSPHIQNSNLNLCGNNVKPLSDSFSIGPRLPSHMLNKFKPSDTSTPSNINSQIHLSSENNQQNDLKTIGPSLPPTIKQLQGQGLQHSGEKTVDSEDDQEMYGPLPAGMSTYSAAEIALEERALQLQIDQLAPQGNNEPVRESWMIELPEAKAANFGLGPRQFRNRAGPDMSDRSSWTDIPGEKGKKKSNKKKVDLKEETELRELQKRDKEQESLTKKHKRKSKSLVEMHQEKLRRKGDGTGTTERIPFSRETDLQVNKFDDAQKKAIMKKAQLLDDRFSSGKTKFL